MESDVDLVSAPDEPRRGTIGGQDTVGDIDDCQFCGCTFNQAYGGYFVGDADVGSDAKGGTAEIFRQAAEDHLGDREWLGFQEEDIGPVCDSCSWKLQSKRTGNRIQDSERKTGEEQ